MDVSINLWAVLVAGAANMVIGALWYGPVFGKQWMKLVGLTKSDMRSMPLSPMQAMTGGFVVALVMAYVLGYFADVWAAASFQDAFQLAFWIWLGFVATTQIGDVLWLGRSWKLFVLNTVASLVSFVVMAWILVAW